MSSLSDPDLAARIATLPPGTLLGVAGFDAAALRRVLEGAAAGRTSLELDLAGARTADAATGRILDDLAHLVLAAWPDWPEPDPAARTGVSSPWRRAARRRAGAGQPPRFPSVAAEVEARQLALVLGPRTPVLLASLDVARPERAAPIVHALEWFARHGFSAAVLCSERPPPVPPYDRILHGFVTVERWTPAPVESRLITAKGPPPGHSPTEAQVWAALAADAELAPLFAANATVRTGRLGFAPRVDLLWRDGRVVVELDGPEHCAEPKYGADRHRDYELTVAGYLVVRITNEQVALDLERAVGKIRAVVRLRREGTRA